MRIAYLVNQYPTVSHTFIRREIRALEQQGFDVLRISMRQWGGELLNPEDREEHKKTRFVLDLGPLTLMLAVARALFTGPGRFIDALLLTWRVSRKSERAFPFHFVYLAEACVIAAWLREGEVQHLHAHFGTNSAEVAMLVHALGGPPWSFTVHGPEEFDKPEFLALSEKLRRCKFVAAISSFGRAQLMRFSNEQDWPKINVVHCGLDEFFLRHAGSAPPETRRLVCVGRLSAQKGHICLVEAAALLAKEGIAFEIVFAGDGEMRSEIEALIASYQLQDRITITGWISGEDVRKYLQSTRALVLPSFAEGLPVVIMEAMALQRPVISTFVAGIPELVEPGKHGWLVPASDVPALAQAMRTCLETPLEKLATMGAAAKAQALERHDVNKEAGKLAALIKASGKPGGTPSILTGWRQQSAS